MVSSTKHWLIGVVAVAVPLHHCRGEQTNLVVPHKGFLVDAVQGCKLPDGKQPIVLGHFLFSPLTIQLLYSLPWR